MEKLQNIDSLFEEHSSEEIEKIRDDLAQEIVKRTELLKSIVKDKYKDIVETSDAIHSMKCNLQKVEQSLWELDKRISEFHISIKEPIIKGTGKSKLNTPSKNQTADSSVHKQQELSGIIKDNMCEIWKYFDTNDLKTTVQILNETIQLVEKNQDKVDDILKLTVDRAKETIQNNLWHKIKCAQPDQVGIIAGSDQLDLYRMSFNSAMNQLVKQLREELSDTTFHCLIKRYQTGTFIGDASSQVQVPKTISPELSNYLFKVCQTINTIAGFDLSRLQIVESLKVTIARSLQVYSEILSSVQELKAETKRRRASQLHFDLLYLRILLNTSKNIDLIEELDPEITQLVAKYEVMLDTIELYMISEALHSNATQLSRSTFRLYGLLIPHLQ